MDDYLKGANRASAASLLVICRYLASQSEGVSERDLQQALLAHNPGEFSDRAPRGSMIEPALQVGEDLALFSRPDSVSRKWRIDPLLREPLADLATLSTHFILRRLCSRAVAAVTAGSAVPDLAIALAWFLQQNPLAPFSTSWDGDPNMASQPPEETIRATWRDSGQNRPVQSKEQWRALQRWAVEFGLAISTELGRGRSVITPDPTRAVAEALADLPRHAPVSDWFRQLFLLLPVLGGRALTSVVPDPAKTNRSIPAATAAAVIRLERAGRVRLGHAADSIDTLTLEFGNRERRISEVSILEENQ